MTLNIGRVIIVDDPDEVAHSGDGLSIAGWFFGTTFAHASVIRQQLLGLDGNEDEPVVPVRWSLDAAVDGYYRVGTVDVTPVRAVSPRDFGFQYAVQLSRVQGGFALPVCEVATAATLRTNAVGAASVGGTATGRVWFPLSSSFRAGRLSDGKIAPVVTSAAFPRVTATGSVVYAGFSPGVSVNFMAVTSAVLPADYYDGAVMIEQSVGGVYYPVVGDQIGNVVGNLLRIGNGLVRATFHTDGVISSEIFDGTVWESATSFSLLNAGLNTWVAEGGWKILRNDPAACSISVSAVFSTTGYPTTVTLYLERGKMLFEVFADGMFYDMDQSTDLADTLQLRATAATAATAISVGGIRQTSNNGQGHRWMLMSPHVVTNDLTNGRITIAAQSAPLIAQFAIGWERDGSTATTIYSTAAVAAEYFGVTGMRQRVVSK